MAVRIRLSDSEAFVVDGSFLDLQKAVGSAIEENVPLIDVRHGNGQIRSINPRLIDTLGRNRRRAPGSGLLLAPVAGRFANPS